MRIGYLQLSPQQTHESGLVRYGRYIAEAVAQLPGVEVKIHGLTVGDKTGFKAELKPALRALQNCDVLHLQYSKYLGLTGWKKLSLLKQIRRQFKGKLCITLHDVYVDLYPAYDIFEAWKFENKRLRRFSNNQSLALRSTLTCLWQNHLADKAILQWILNHADQVLVCSLTEAERLRPFKIVAPVSIIPHFVEPRAALLPMEEAKRSLGFNPTDIVLTLQGFIFRTKGHALLLDALSQLPATLNNSTLQLVFAGGMAPNQAALQRELTAQIQRLDLGDRVRITGYLSEPDLECYLAASDLGICPFRIASASGSLSTWIAMGRPILAYDLPQIEELNQFVPGAIATFSDYTPESLATAIEAYLNPVQQAPDPAQDQAQTKMRALRDQLSLAQIAIAHQQAYAGKAPEPETFARPALNALNNAAQ